jgi:lipopolysaccharide transport system ATP-binding protein
VSHNEWVLKETCRRGVLLSHGRVAAEGDINSLLDIYHAANVEAASLSVSATGHRIRILEMDLVPSGERSIPLHGPVEVTAQVEIADDVRQPVVALAIADAQARVVLGTYSDENGVSLTPGRHTVTMRIDDLPLPPGPYRFEVFAFERDGSPQGEDALRLDIEVTGDVPNDWEHGLVHVPTRWGVAPPVL